MKAKNKELVAELKEVNNDIKTLESNLIKGLQVVGIEQLNLTSFLDQLEVLQLRKNKIKYLIALDC